MYGLSSVMVISPPLKSSCAGSSAETPAGSRETMSANASKAISRLRFIQTFPSIVH